MPQTVSKVFSIGLLAAAASCSAMGGGSVAEGDRLFSTGYFHDALIEYEAVGGSSPDAELRSRITETRYQIVADRARTAIHLEDPDAARTHLEEAARIIPDHPLTAELRLRAAELTSEILTIEAFELFAEDEPAAAVILFGEALKWNPNHVRAQVGLADARVRAEKRYEQGEEFFFQGLDALREARDSRAYTYFQHAAHFWGADSRAGELEEEIGEMVASELVSQAELSLELGNEGAAWLALRQAAEMNPENEDLKVQLEELDQRLRATEYLTQADIMLRVHNIKGATDQLEKAEALAGPSQQEELEQVRRRLDRAQNEVRYRKARGYEQDNQIQLAVELYQAILVASGEEGYEDAAERYRENLRRLDSAKEHYQAALDAQENGEAATYEAELRETVRLASDFADALERLRAIEG